MAGEFEVTRLYAKIVPKLADNFRADLQRQINVATKTGASRATAKIGVEVNDASVTAAKKKIETRLSTIKAKIRVEINVKAIDQAMRGKRTIEVDANTNPAERAIKQSFQKIDGTSRVFAKGISDNISRNLKNGFQIPPGASSSIERHLKEVARESDRAAAKMRRDFDRAFNAIQREANKPIKINVNDTELEKLKFETAIQNAKKRGVEIKVDVDALTAERKLIAISKDRTVELKVDVDKSLSSQVGVLSNLLGSGGGFGSNSSKNLKGLASSVDMLGRSFGRMSDVAGIAGVAVSGTAKIISLISGSMSTAAEEGGGFAAAMGKLFTSLAAGAALTAIVGTVLSMIAALAAGTLAAAGFTIAAVVMGAVVSALAVGLTGLASAIAVAVGALGGLAAGIGVVALAIVPVASAFSEFLNVQGEAPKATNAATKAVASQAKGLRSAEGAIRSAGRAVKDANKAISDSGYAVVRAQRGVRDAGESLKEAYRGQLTARQRLNDAEEKAKENLEALSRAARDAAGQEEDAEIRLIRAQERLAELNPLDNDSTDYREALRDVEQAERDLADQREDNKKTLDDYEKAKKKGIKGDQDVIDARQGVEDADRRVRDAQEAALDAEKALADAKYNQARAVDAQKEAVINLRNAQLGLNDANTAGTVAYDGSTAAQRKMNKQFGQLTAQGQRFFNTLKDVYNFVLKLSAIAQDAFLPGLVTAFDKLMTLGPLVESAVKNIGEEMGDLAVKFADVFSSTAGRNAFDSLMKTSADSIKVLGGAVADFTGELLPAMAKLASAAKPITQVFGSGIVTLGKSIASLFDSLSKSGVIDAMSAVANSLFNVIANVLTRFGIFMEKIAGTMSKLAPSINDNLDKFVNAFFDVLAEFTNSGLVESFLIFLGQLGDMFQNMIKSGFIREFGATMGKALEVIGQGLSDLFSDPTVIQSFIDLFQIMPPLIKQFMDLLPQLLPAFLDFLTTSAEFTKELSPQILGAITLALQGMTLALTTVMTIAAGVKAIFDNPWLATISSAVLAAAAAFAVWTGAIAAYEAVTKIAIAVQAAFNLVMSLNPVGLVIIAIVALVAAIIVAYKKSETFRKVVETVWAAIKVAIYITWLVIKDIFNKLKTFFLETLPNAARYVWDRITHYWNAIKDAIESAINRVKGFLGGLKNSFFDILDKIGNKLGSWKDGIVNAFTKTRDGIKTVWDNLKGVVKDPVSFVVNTVYNNGIRKLWNGIAGKIGLGELDEIKGFARGGKLPGNSGMRYKDDRLGMTPNGPVKLAGGEFIVNAPATKEFLPLLKQINSGGLRGKNAEKAASGGLGIPGFGIGGFLGDLYKKGKGAVASSLGKIGDAVRGALSVVVDPAISATRKILPAFNKDKSTFQNAVYGVPHKVLDKVSSFVHKDDKKNKDLSSGGAIVGGDAGKPFPPGYRNQIANLAAAGFHLRFADSQLTGGGHSPTSNHYKGRAIDIGVGTNGQAQVERVWDYLVANYAKTSKELYWAQKAVNYRHGQAIGPTDKTNHIHWAMKNGGLVSGLGGATADRIMRYLSNGEFVMNSKATSALGAANLANANKMAIGGASRREIRANTNLAGVEMNPMGGVMSSNDRYFDINVNVTEDHQAELLVNRLNSMI